MPYYQQIATSVCIRAHLDDKPRAVEINKLDFVVCYGCADEGGVRNVKKRHSDLANSLAAESPTELTHTMRIIFLTSFPFSFGGVLVKSRLLLST